MKSPTAPSSLTRAAPSGSRPRKKPTPPGGGTPSRPLTAGALAAKLTELGLAFRQEDGRRPAVSLLLLNDDDAARLLRDLVLAGVPVSSFAPASGALEETYMNLEGERR